MPTKSKVVFGFGSGNSGGGVGDDEPVLGQTATHTIRGGDHVDVDAPCYICDKVKGSAGNDMLFCDGCNRCVHQMCSGTTVIPKGMFFCGICTSPLYEKAAVESQTYKIFKEVVEGLGGWVKETTKKLVYPPMHDTIFSMESMTDTVWYKSMLGLSAAETRSKMTLIVPHKMFAISELIYDNSTLMKNHRSTFSIYGMWCGIATAGGGTDADRASYAMDTAEKAANFLRYYMEFTCANKKRSDFPVAETAFNALRNAISPLQYIADIYGYDEYKKDLGKQKPVAAVYSAAMKERNKVRNDVQDNVATSRIHTKTLTMDDKERMAAAWMDGASVQEYSLRHYAEAAQMRDLLLTCLLDAIGRRGEDIRAIRLPMFVYHELSRVQPVHCIGIGASVRMVKERVNAEETMLTWVRTQNRMICPIGALAMYLVWMNDLNNRVSILDTIRNDLKRMDTFSPASTSTSTTQEKWISEWWKIHLVFSKDPTKAIASSTHIHGAGRILKAARVEGKTAKTQLHRSTTAINLIEAGLSVDDVETFQGWRHTTATDVYIRSAFKAAPLLAAGEWESTKEYYCWWETPKDEVDNIPQQLLDLVFPGLDELAEYAEEQYKKYKYDLSAVEFTKILKYLRKVFLEDAVFKRAKFPGFPVYRHIVFDTPEWMIYAESESERVRQREELYEAKLANPELAKSIIQHTERNMATLAARIDDLQEMKEALTAAAASASTSTAATTAQSQSQSSIQEIMTWKDTNMVVVYGHWEKHRKFYSSYIDAGRRLPWKDAFGIGKEAKPHRTRFSKLKIWLQYVDRCVAEGASADDVIAKCVQIAKSKKMLHSVFIKDAFYNVSNGSVTPTISAEEFKGLLKAAGLPEL
jgi:hypothetical protein